MLPFDIPFQVKVQIKFYWSLGFHVRLILSKILFMTFILHKKKDNTWNYSI